ncbi:MAG TPA: hypothetical protein VET51_06535 [Burkholderiales bacterium]|nr:hypothetical protein [Burkholderiales bacterium]
MKLSEHLMFLALMIPTILLLTAGAVSFAWPDSRLSMPQDPQTLAITEFLHAQLEDDFVSR